MLWSPIVKASAPTAKHDQLLAVHQVRNRLRADRNVDIQLIINETYKACLDELRAHAAIETKELKSTVLRLFQIEALLDRHLKCISRRNSVL
jgi:hypothetical protein